MDEAASRSTFAAFLRPAGLSSDTTITSIILQQGGKAAAGS
jgi:hypothetical protein